MSGIFKWIRHFAHDRRSCLFYAYCSAQGTGREDPDVKVYDVWADIPENFRKIAVPSPWRSVLYHRMRRGEARFLCLSEDGRRLDAYGWIQDWRPFRRKFGALAQSGTMLGPYWTAPEARGRGLYGRLLGHSLSLCSTQQAILIYTSPDNVASQRGIEKAGFRRLGRWDLVVWFGIFSRLRKITS